VARARAHAAGSIDASPADVYQVLADYRRHHPQIMPPSLFSDLEVETGGVGAGTVFHITLRVAGRRQRLHMQVAEPEPGHVLTETDLDTGVVTAFTVSSDDGRPPTLTRISSEWEAGGGLRGLADRLATPLLLRWIFTRQLRRLARYLPELRRAEGA